MKTTVEISDPLLAEAKALAQQKGLTLRQLIEEGLRESIREHHKPKPKFRLKDGSVGGGWLQRDYTWDEILEMCYEGRGGYL
jgi:hypothetical protein